VALAASYEPHVVALQSLDDPSLWPTVLDWLEGGTFVVAALTDTQDVVGTLARLRREVPQVERLAEHLLGIVAQRIVRRPCVECRKEYHPSSQKLRAFGLSTEWVSDTTLYLANQCDHCLASGYRGQSGLFEVLLPDEVVRTWLCSSEPADVLRRHLAASGHRTLLQDGLRLLRLGWTTLEELDRVLALRRQAPSAA
jgi:type II secretory ATPase GspE/PulE/Tfp pilus assembly ATPase PilB-like protein